MWKSIKNIGAAVKDVVVIAGKEVARRACAERAPSGTFFTSLLTQKTHSKTVG
jgi:hypothetical protein